MLKLRFIPFFLALSLHAQTVRFQTSLGGIDVVLTPSITPLTVVNFMSYANSGAYNNTIIHRSLSPNAPTPTPPYVIQGGGYALGPGNVPVLIGQNTPVTNEFKTSNTAGTLAMALSTGIDTAQSQWFFNTVDNSSSLDSQDFTVFGSVANDASSAVMNNINALTTWAVNFGQDADFANLPLQNYSCPNTTACPLIKTANYIFVKSIAPIAPADSAAGVADAATEVSAGKTGISPGEFVTLYGVNLGPTQLTTWTLDSTGTLFTTSLEGTQVLFNGIPGPMVFTSDGQIAAIVPYGIAGQSSVNVVVSYLGIQTSPIPFNVVPATPGVFTLNESGMGDAVIVRSGDSSVIGTANPASSGDSLILYAEGYGVAAGGTSLPDGALVTGATLPLPAAATVLLIDGKPVSTLSAGAAPGEVNGVLQIKFICPALAPGSHQIQVQVGSVASPAGVTIQTQ